MFSRNLPYAIIPLRRVLKGNIGGDFMKTIKKILAIGGMAGLLMSTLIINKVEVTATATTATSIDKTSADNSLKSIKLSEGTLSPSFQYNVVKYSATVGPDTTSVKVDAQVSNKNAKVLSITGTDQLKEGKNTIKITVEAGNGSLAVYVIEVTKETKSATTPATPTTPITPEEAAKPSGDNSGVIFEFDSKQYQVVNNHEATDLPTGFTQVNMKIKNKECIGYRYNQSDIYLVYFSNVIDEKDAGYYVFDLKSDIPCFELGAYPPKIQENSTEVNEDGIDQKAARESLQKNYNELYAKYKKETEQARKTLYIGIVVVALLVILLINVVIIERMKRRSDDHEDEYLNACANNSEFEEDVPVEKGSIKNTKNQTSRLKDDEIEFIDFDDL